MEAITSSHDKLRTEILSSTQTLITESEADTSSRIKELEKSLAALKDNIKQDLDAKLDAKDFISLSSVSRPFISQPPESKALLLFDSVILES
jgi:hypothetical protein